MDKSSKGNGVKKYVLILSLLLCACSTDKPMSLYAINMMYACECPRYRVFMIEDSESKLIGSEIDFDKNTALSQEIWRVTQLEAPKKDSFIGVDLELEFQSAERENEFNTNEGISPI